MQLSAFQSLLAEVYALDVPYRVDDFLTTDASLARALDQGGREIDEKLLIAEGGGEADVSLYLDPALLERLDRDDPLRSLSGANLEDFLTVLEGVSHFVYYAWHAQHDREVTLLELELQAEVDKFVTAATLLHRQQRRQSPGLHSWLFDLPKLDSRLDGTELDRYRVANRYAGKYCRRLARAQAGDPADESVRRELRRFYRLSQQSKLEHIERPINAPA